ncbi:MAG TPA: hypothetical protein VMQ17_13490 [Candidatus Sulfotelmatobacter sp.]|nr:hypothetical protein [Candidatus Sulfotelmatobacter sp.]
MVRSVKFLFGGAVRFLGFQKSRLRRFQKSIVDYCLGEWFAEKAHEKSVPEKSFTGKTNRQRSRVCIIEWVGRELITFQQGKLRIPGDGDQRFPNDRDRDSWMIVISVPTEGDQ